MKKRMTTLVAVVLLLAVCLSACGKSEEKYEQGTIDGNVYLSSWIGLRFTCPDDMTMSTQQEIEDMMSAGGAVTGVADEQLETLHYEFMAQALLTNVNLIVEPMQINVDEKGYAQISKTQLEGLSSQGLNYTVGDTEKVTIGGKTFTLLPAVLDVQGMEFLQNMYLLQKGDYMVVMSVSGMSEADIQAVLDQFEALN